LFNFLEGAALQSCGKELFIYHYDGGYTIAGDSLTGIQCLRSAGYGCKDNLDQLPVWQPYVITLLLYKVPQGS